MFTRPLFFGSPLEGGGGCKILIICWMLFFRKRIPAVSQEGNFVCILTCDIFILTRHTNCFLCLDIYNTLFIHLTPSSFPLFYQKPLVPDPFFIQVLFLPSLFFYQPLFIKAFFFKLLFCRKRAFFVSSLCDICFPMLPFIQDSCSFESNSLTFMSSLG